MPQNMLRVGLAGLGRHGMRYAQHLLAGDVPDAQLVAIHRRDKQLGAHWAHTRRLTFHETLEGMAADPQVDLLVAALPPALHATVVKTAAAHKKPLLIEKPLSESAASAREAVAAARAAGIKVMVSQTMRFNAVVQALRDHIPHIGPLHLVAINNRFEPANRVWFNDPAHGGMVINTGAHGVDLIRFLTGSEITAVHAFANRLVTTEVDDVFAAVMKLEPGGVLATLDNTWATGGRTGRIELVGQHGQLIADHIHNTLAEVRGRRMEKLPLPEPVPTVREVLRAFTRCLLEDAPIPVTLEDGLMAVEGAEKIARAIEEGKQA